MDALLQPIRTPGAVQGFGVLVALDELEDTLVVRQVSEVGHFKLSRSFYSELRLP